MTHELDIQLDRLRRLPYSRRKRAFDLVQINVSRAKFGDYGPLIAWPDVVMYMTADIINQSIAEAMSEDKRN